MVHFPCGSTQAEAETAAQSVSPGDEGMLGPQPKFSRSNCPSFRQANNNLTLNWVRQMPSMAIIDDKLGKNAVTLSNS